MSKGQTPPTTSPTTPPWVLGRDGEEPLPQPGCAPCPVTSHLGGPPHTPREAQKLDPHRDRGERASRRRPQLLSGPLSPQPPPSAALAGPLRGAGATATCSSPHRSPRPPARRRPARLQRAKFPPQVRGTASPPQSWPGRSSRPPAAGGSRRGRDQGLQAARAASRSRRQTSAPGSRWAPALGPRATRLCLPVPAGLRVRREHRAAAAEGGSGREAGRREGRRAGRGARAAAAAAGSAGTSPRQTGGRAGGGGRGVEPAPEPRGPLPLPGAGGAPGQPGSRQNAISRAGASARGAFPGRFWTEEGKHGGGPKRGELGRPAGRGRGRGGGRPRGGGSARRGAGGTRPQPLRAPARGRGAGAPASAARPSIVAAAGEGGRGGPGGISASGLPREGAPGRTSYSPTHGTGPQVPSGGRRGEGGPRYPLRRGPVTRVVGAAVPRLPDT